MSGSSLLCPLSLPRSPQNWGLTLIGASPVRSQAVRHHGARAFWDRVVQNEPMSDRQVVYLLWHGDDVDDETPDAKLLGVYSSEEVAQDRIARSATLPGFAEHPDDFLITRYAFDEDQWTSGYVEVEFPLPSD
jgi:hypothetical protein